MMGQILIVIEKDWKVISKNLERMSIQNSVPERSPTCLVLGFM